MPPRQFLSAPAEIDFDAIRATLQIPDGYPADAVREAELAAAAAAAGFPALPDRTDLPLVTIDPPGARDLDQAVHLERDGRGYRVSYAIADVTSFVPAGGALDRETRRRGATLYSPDGSTPLHPEVLSHGAASLLPGVDRAAVLWTITLDEAGEARDVGLMRALVRSRAQLDYAGVQADLDADRPHPSIALLPEVGRLRQAIGRRRHAITLDLPDAEVVPGPDGHWTLELRAVADVEDYNAQISLLTGTCAASIMLEGLVGLLRTLPPPTPAQVDALRRATAALGIAWPSGTPASEVIGGLDGSKPRDAAFLEDAVRLLRGAGYTPFDGQRPSEPGHGGVGAPYAHVTAPLRRLADRYATEVCLALHAGADVPAWVLAALPELPAFMAAADRQASALAKACQGAVSVFLLEGREGDEFTATVLQIDRAKDRATVVLHEPPVRAHCPADGLAEGTVIRVRLRSADRASNRFVVEPAALEVVPGQSRIAPPPGV